MGRSDFSPYQTSGLPEELKKELNLAGNTEAQLLRIFEEGGGTLNVSEILIGYFKLFKEVKKRVFVSSLLYRMRKNGLISPTGKKGEYTTKTEL